MTAVPPWKKGPSRWMGQKSVERGAQHCVTVVSVYAYRLAEKLRNSQANQMRV